MVWTYPTVCCTIEIFEKSNVWTSRAIKSYYVWIILDNLLNLIVNIYFYRMQCQMLWKRVSLRGTTVRWFTICWYILWHCSSSYHFHHGHNFYSSQNKAGRERRDLHWSDSWLRYDQPSSTCRFELHRISKLRGGGTRSTSNTLRKWLMNIAIALYFDN